MGVVEVLIEDIEVRAGHTDDDHQRLEALDGIPHLLPVLGAVEVPAVLVVDGLQGVQVVVLGIPRDVRLARKQLVNVDLILGVLMEADLQDVHGDLIRWDGVVGQLLHLENLGRLVPVASQTASCSQS